MTKREFLKVLGLGLAFMPFVSCFDSDDKREEKESDDTRQPEQQPASDGLKVT